MKAPGETYFGRALGLLADVVMRHRWLFLWPQMVLFILAIVYAKTHFSYDPNRDDLVGGDQKYHQLYEQFKTEFRSQDDLVVVVESENPEKNRQFVERLGIKLEAETNTFTNVFYRTDFKMLGNRALMLAHEQDLVDLRSQLTNYLPFIQRFTQATNLDSLFNLINVQFGKARNEDNPENNALMNAVPVLRRIVEQAGACLRHQGVPPSPGIAALFGAGDEDVYLVFTNKESENRIYLVTAQARNEDLNDFAVDRLRSLVALTQREIPGLNIGVTGEPVLDHDEMEQSSRDAMLASILSLVLSALIFIYGYQETGRPLKATFCLLVGLAYTLAFTFLSVGHLNILTVTFLPILIGLAIDFGVHLITRYEEELRLGRTEEQAMRTAMVYTGQGIFSGAMTTAFAFMAMAATHFKGIQEMGIICGGGMVICLIPMMTLLPVLLFRGRQNVMDKESVRQPALRARLERIWLRNPVITVSVTAFLTLLALTQYRRVSFDYNLLDMQSRGLPSVVFEKKLLNSAGRSVLYAAVMANTPEEATNLQQKILALTNVVDSVDCMAENVIGEQTEKRRLIGLVKQDIAGIHFAPPDLKPVNLTELAATLFSTSGWFGLAATQTQTNEPDISKQLRSLQAAIDQLKRQMLGGSDIDREVASRKLAAFQQALFNDIRDTFTGLQEQDNRTPLRATNLPPALRSRFIGMTGKYLLQIYPRKDVWNRTNQQEFVQAISQIDARVTGTPVELLYYTKLLKDSYQQAAWYALAAIVIMILFHFRTFSSVVLALLPVGIGFAWLCGIMGFFGIQFNPANIMTLPLVIGIGVTNGIHILNRFAEERRPGILSKSTGKAVFVSGLTTMSGFGSLIIAQHQGIKSLGIVMSVGVATCMIAALTFLPAMLILWRPWRDAVLIKQPSGDNAQSTLGREEPR